MSLNVDKVVLPHQQSRKTYMTSIPPLPSPYLSRWLQDLPARSQFLRRSIAERVGKASHPTRAGVYYRVESPIHAVVVLTTDEPRSHFLLVVVVVFTFSRPEGLEIVTSAAGASSSVAFDGVLLVL